MRASWIIHIKMVPPIKPVTTIDPLSVINGGDIVPSFPAKLIAAPLNTVSISCDCGWANEYFVGIIGVLKYLMIPKIIIQTGFSTTKTIKFNLEGSRPSSFQFTISKVKFAGENRVFAWHPKSGFIRID